MDMIEEQRRERRNRDLVTRPPEVVLELGITIGMLLDAYEQSGHEHEAGDILDAITVGASTVRRRLEAQYMLGTSGFELELTVNVVMHRHVRDHPDLSRPHLHVQIERDATTEFGRPYEVGASLVEAWALPLLGAFQDATCVEMQNRLGVKFPAPPDGSWLREVGGLDHLIGTAERRSCPGLDGRPVLYPAQPRLGRRTA